MLSRLLTVGLLAFVHAAFSQIQLTDYNFQKSDFLSAPSQFIEYNDHLYFVANHDKVGGELWRSDGTANGTTMVKDINLGPRNSIISNFLIFKGKLYFIADDGTNGYQLWQSDGTEAGTKPVSQSLHTPVSTIVANSTDIFFLQTVSGRVEVWKSTGVPGETSKVRGDLPTLNRPANLTSALGLTFFTTQGPGTDESRLWRSDGTPDGTYAVTDFIAGNGASLENGNMHPTQFVEYNDALYFIARSENLFGSNSVGLLKTDGTVEGTTPVTGIMSDNVQFATAFTWNNKMYFTFYQMYSDIFTIWSSEGTSESTNLEFEYHGEGFFNASPVSIYNDKFYFSIGNPAGGSSLVQFDPVSHSVNPIVELTGPLTRPIAFTPLVVHLISTASNGLYVGARDNQQRARLLFSDGTTEGTHFIPGFHVLNLIEFKGKLYFGGGTGEDNELCVSDGTLVGTQKLKDLAPSTIGLMVNDAMVAINDVAVFRCYDSLHGSELWRTDGTEAGTYLLRDILPGKSGSLPTRILPFGNRLVFYATVENGTRDLWETDGSTEGTKLIPVIPADASIIDIIKLDDKLILIARLKNGTTSLFVYDQSGNGQEIGNLGLTEYNNPYIFIRLAAGDGVLYVSALGNLSEGLWISDGTSEGTRKLGDFDNIQRLGVINGRAFIADKNWGDPLTYLKTFDPTTGQIGSIKTLAPDEILGNTIIQYKGLIIFDQYNANGDKQLFMTDATPDNVIALGNMVTGMETIQGPISWAIHNDILYFTASTPEHGSELWTTDGTIAGTQLVADIVAGPASSKPSNLISCGDRLYFTAYTPEKGYEVWSTDGTSEGTSLELDVNRGAMYSNPFGYALVNDNLVFFANTPNSGVQLFNGTMVTSTAPEYSKRALSVFPNPSSDLVKIDVGNARGMALTVYNAAGVPVIEEPLLTESPVIDMQAFPAGLYYFRFTRNTWQQTVKVLKR